MQSKNNFLVPYGKISIPSTPPKKENAIFSESNNEKTKDLNTKYVQ